jgi:hypothetical protein
MTGRLPIVDDDLLAAQRDEVALLIARRPGFPATATAAERSCVDEAARALCTRLGYRSRVLTPRDLDTLITQADASGRALIGAILAMEMHRRQERDQDRVADRGEWEGDGDGDNNTAD